MKLSWENQYLDIQLCDKHFTYLVLISEYLSIISKIFILTYFNILGSKVEYSDITTEYILSKKYRELVNNTQTINYLSKFILSPSKYPYPNNTLMPTNNLIIETFLKRIFRNRLQFSPRILFYVFYRLKTGASKW